MHAEITALYVALTSLLFIGLSYRVSAQRKRSKVSLGTGDDPALEKAVRIQANLAEYAPVALLLMLVYELNGGAVWLFPADRPKRLLKQHYKHRSHHLP